MDRTAMLNNLLVVFVWHHHLLGIQAIDVHRNIRLQNEQNLIAYNSSYTKYTVGVDLPCILWPVLQTSCSS